MKLGILYSVILLLSIILGCSDSEPTADSYPDPFIKISNPLMNSNVPDSTTIKITSNINDLVRVELYIDQNIPSQQAVFQDPPYEYLWNTRYYDDGSQHILQARGYDSGGNELDSKYVIVNVFRFRPDNLQANLQADTLIVLEWNDNCSYETGFEIEEAVNDSNFTKIGEVDSNITTYNAYAVYNLDSAYYFRVRAKSKDDYSGYSNIAAANVQLNMPVDLDINFLSDTAAVLSWTDNNAFETDYLIEKYIPNYGHIFIKEVPANTTETVIVDTFLAGQYNDYLLFPQFGNISGTAGRFPFKTFKFPAPSDLMIESSNYNSLTLSWNDDNNYELGFIIERSKNGYIFSEIGRTKSHSFTDSDLDTTTNYSYRVAAYSHYNKSVFSPQKQALYTSKLNQISRFPVIYRISWVELSYDASIIAFGGYSSVDADIYLYHTFTGQQFRILYSTDSTSYEFKQITISPDNSLVAAAGANNYITVWNISTAGVVKRINNSLYPNVMKFSNDGKYLIIGNGRILRFYDVQSWQYESRIISSNDILRMDINYDETVIATGDGYNNIIAWDYNNGNLINQFPGSVDANPMKLNRSGTRLYSVIDNQLIVWDVATASVTMSISNFWTKQHIAVNESRDIAASSVNYTDLGMWELSRGDLIQQLSSPSGFQELFFTPDNNYLIGREYYQYYDIWKVDKGWISPIR